MRDLISAVDEILYNEWDPIGVNDTPEAFDEYSSYAPGLLRYAMGGDPEVVADQLGRITRESMGLGDGDRQHNLAIAQKLIDIASQA
ncbi:hypothetical protein COB72_01980 [bacterium]|nr:MAG: hypothetical protein COB72_01980 [bacterium]